MSQLDTCLLSWWHPAQRRQEREQGQCEERENLLAHVKGDDEASGQVKSTDGVIRGGCWRSSAEVVVITMERRPAEY